MKKIHLIERAASGQIEKNEQYTYEQLKRKVRMMSGRFFYHKIWGGIRRAALEKTFVIFAQLTDEDVTGKGSPKNK